MTQGEPAKIGMNWQTTPLRDAGREAPLPQGIVISVSHGVTVFSDPF